MYKINQLYSGTLKNHSSLHHSSFWYARWNANESLESVNIVNFYRLQEDDLQ